MSEQNQNLYGYQDDNVQVSPSFNFGLNAAFAKLKQFEWIPNGGKDGAEQEALEIKFQAGEREVSYRKFPVTRAFLKDGSTTSDPAAPEMQAERDALSQVVTHILHLFVTTDQIKAAFSRPIPDFKTYCQIAMSLLPGNFRDISLDIFFQYQSTLKAPNKVTFLELPANMKQGKWLAVAQNPAPGIAWKEMRVPGAGKGVTALYYISVDANGNPVTEGDKAKIHPFTRTGWFMESNFATQQKDPNQQEGAATTGGVPPATPPTPSGTAQGWDD